MALPMMCESCQGRWVALMKGSSVNSKTFSVHLHRGAVQCPRCGAEGVADPETIFKHQQHPQTVATPWEAPR